MHSWIFRHRAALARIYGNLAARQGAPAEPARPAERSSEAAASRPAHAGRVERRGEEVVLLPASRVRT